MAPSASPIDVDINENIDWAIIGSHMMGCALSPCLLRKDRRQKTKSRKFVKKKKKKIQKILSCWLQAVLKGENNWGTY